MSTSFSSLVSVIIPTHNRSLMLNRAVKSVLSQTYTELECIVIDDASKDQTQDVINSFHDDRVKYLRHDENKGASAARNTGLKHANGEFIAFLDDDDLWLNEKLEKQMSMIRSLPETVGMVYCWMDYFDGNNNLVYEHHPEYKGFVFPEVLDSQRIGGCPTLLIRSSILNKIGGFDVTLKRGNDGDFIRRIALKYEVDFIPEVLVNVFIGHGKPRIGQNDKTGIKNHIISQLTKINKFEDQLQYYPNENANIFFNLARSYAQLHDWRNCISYYYKGININPLSMKLYISLFHHLKIAIKTIIK